MLTIIILETRSMELYKFQVIILSYSSTLMVINRLTKESQESNINTLENLWMKKSKPKKKITVGSKKLINFLLYTVIIIKKIIKTKEFL